MPTTCDHSTQYDAASTVCDFIDDAAEDTAMGMRDPHHDGDDRADRSALTHGSRACLATPFLRQPLTSRNWQ